MKHEVRAARRKARKKERRRRKRGEVSGDGVHIETGQRLMQLRELCYEEPTKAVWLRICGLLHAWTDRASLEMAVDYLEGHLESWPVGVRLCERGSFLFQWLERLCAGKEEPRARLIRTLVLDDMDDGWLETVFCSRVALPFVRGVRLSGEATHTFHVRKVIKTSWMAHVEEIEIVPDDVFGRAGLGVFEVLGQCAALKRLKKLSVQLFRLRENWQRELNFLYRAPWFSEQLKHCTIRGEYARVVGVGPLLTGRVVCNLDMLSLDGLSVLPPSWPEKRGADALSSIACLRMEDVPVLRFFPPECTMQGISSMRFTNQLTAHWTQAFSQLGDRPVHSMVWLALEENLEEGTEARRVEILSSLSAFQMADALQSLKGRPPVVRALQQSVETCAPEKQRALLGLLWKIYVGGGMPPRLVARFLADSLGVLCDDELEEIVRWFGLGDEPRSKALEALPTRILAIF